MKVTLANRQRRIPLRMPWLRKAAALALPLCASESADGAHALRELPEIGVILVSDAAIARLHAGFMGIEGATDVLTFRHGEIVISAETADAMAREFNHPVEQEIALYSIHGFLHLNGFDDLEERPAAKMRRAQERILKAVLSQLPHPENP